MTKECSSVKAYVGMHQLRYLGVGRVPWTCLNFVTHQPVGCSVTLICSTPLAVVAPTQCRRDLNLFTGLHACVLDVGHGSCTLFDFFWTPEWTVHGGPLLSMDTSMGICGHDREGPLRYTDAHRGPFGVHFGVHFDVHFGDVRGHVHKRPRSCPILCPPMSTGVHQRPNERPGRTVHGSP